MSIVGKTQNASAAEESLKLLSNLLVEPCGDDSLLSQRSDLDRLEGQLSNGLKQLLINRGMNPEYASLIVDDEQVFAPINELLESLARDIREHIRADYDSGEVAAKEFVEQLTVEGTSSSEKQMQKCGLVKTPDASAAAEFVSSCLMHVHRGLLDCGDKLVVYGNDGYGADPRSQREVELVIEGLKEIGFSEPEFGTDDANCSWAFVIRNYQRLEMPEDAINEMVWDSWFIACEEKQAGEKCASEQA